MTILSMPNIPRLHLRWHLRLFMLSVIALTLLGVSARAAAVTCTSTATGNWNSQSTWGMAGTGCVGAPGGIPGSSDSATIASPHTVTVGSVTTVGNVTVNSGATLNIAGSNWTVNGTTNVSGTLAHTSTGGNETYVGLITINAGGTWNNTINENITIRGGIQNNGSFIAGTTARYSFTTNAQSIGGSNPISMAFVRVNNGAVLTNTGSLTIGTALQTTAGSGTFVNASNATLNLTGTTTTVSTLTATAIGNTVNYIGANQTVYPTSYVNLGLSGSGAKTMSSVITMAGNLTVSGTASMTNNAAFTVGGVWSYSSTATSTLTAATAISIGSLVQTAGTIAAGANTVTVTGSGSNTWSVSGTFTTTGTVIFTGTAPQIGAFIFNNLRFSLGSSNEATLTGNVGTTSTLTLTSGKVVTGAFKLEVTSSCVGVAGSSTAYVVGNLQLHYPTGNSTCTFPVGDSGAYTPVAVSLNAVTSNLTNSRLTARTDSGDHADTTAGTSGITALKSVNRTWTLTADPLLAFTSYNATYHFVSADIDSGTSTSNFIIRRKNASVWSSPTTSSATPLNTSSTGTTFAQGFGEFAIGEAFNLTVAKTATVLCDPVNGTNQPKNIPGAIVRWLISVTNTGVTAVNLTSVTDTLAATTTLDSNLITGAGAASLCFSSTGTPENATGRAFKLALTSSRPGSYPKYFTAAAGDDAAGLSAGQVTINYALAMPAEGTYTAGELRPGEMASFSFNAVVN